MDVHRAKGCLHPTHDVRGADGAQTAQHGRSDLARRVTFRTDGAHVATKSRAGADAGRRRFSEADQQRRHRRGRQWTRRVGQAALDSCGRPSGRRRPRLGGSMNHVSGLLRNPLVRERLHITKAPGLDAERISRPEDAGGREVIDPRRWARRGTRRWRPAHRRRHASVGGARWRRRTNHIAKDLVRHAGVLLRRRPAGPLALEGCVTRCRISRRPTRRPK